MTVAHREKAIQLCNELYGEGNYEPIALEAMIVKVKEDEAKVAQLEAPIESD